MTKMIKEYLLYVEKLLANPENVDFSSEIKKHLVKINIFQHERLVHLIIMTLFVIITMGSFICGLYNWQVQILTAIFLTITCFYIKHYYFLENSVQKMYHQYDEMLTLISK